MRPRYQCPLLREVIEQPLALRNGGGDVDFIGDGDIRIGKLHRADVDHIPQNHHLLPFAFDGEHAVPWRVPTRIDSRNARGEHLIAFKRFQLPRRDVRLQ